MKPLLEHGWLKGLVHITGGGITDNTPRILPADVSAEVQLGSWPVLPIYDLIAKRGNVPHDDMMRTFNMGLGMLLIVSPRDPAHSNRLPQKAPREVLEDRPHHPR